jgi:A/G-specific adenine glycosylase
MTKLQPTPSAIKSFQKTVLDHYKKNGRPMPWRSVTSPYYVFVSEIMLQQTQVPRVMEKFPTFVAAFPDFRTLAKAPVSQVYMHWQGLGYNRRALHLKNAAEQICEKYNGELPHTAEELDALPGIGAATAASIMAFAYNFPSVFIETNIRTVITWHFFKDKEQVSDEEILPIVKQSLFTKNPRVWYWALMDYGTTLKKQMPGLNAKSKTYTPQSKFHGSRRQIRGEILKLLLEQPGLSYGEIAKALTKERIIVGEICKELRAEGFIRADTKKRYTLN